MPNLGSYAKTVVAALFALLTAIYAAMSGPNFDLTDKEWVGVAIATLTALGVYAVPNQGAAPKPGA